MDRALVVEVRKLFDELGVHRLTSRGLGILGRRALLLEHRALRPVDALAEGHLRDGARRGLAVFPRAESSALQLCLRNIFPG